MALADHFLLFKWNQQVLHKLDFQGSRLGLRGGFSTVPLASATRSIQVFIEACQVPANKNFL
jgi:hypothetical protein